MTTPIWKSVGGKTRLLPELLKRLPPIGAGRYFEPFAGGAALFFALQPERAVLGDANMGLIAMYRAVVEDVEAVIAELEPHDRQHSRKHYLAVRRAWNASEYSASAEAAAASLYLNRSCFNGLWRVNRAGAMNVGYGRYADPIGDLPARLRVAAPMLARAELRGCGYEVAVSDAVAGDVVYMDPPYDGGWSAYTSNGFGLSDHARMAHVVRTLGGRGVRCLVSNSDTPSVRALYAGLHIDEVLCDRRINSAVAKRGNAREVLVTA